MQLLITKTKLNLVSINILKYLNSQLFYNSGKLSGCGLQKVLYLTLVSKWVLPLLERSTNCRSDMILTPILADKHCRMGKSTEQD